MSALGEFPETPLRRLLRAAACFTFGAVLGCFPAVLAMAVTEGDHIQWQVPTAFVLGFAVLFCLLGLFTRGQLVAGLLKFFGKEVNWQ